MGSRLDLFADIRRDDRVEGLSIRELARRYGVHRRTVRQALASAFPPPRKERKGPAPKLDPVRDLIDAMLAEDVGAPKKQRQTATRIHQRLIDEHGSEVSYSTVATYVKRRRVEIGLVPRPEVFVPQEHAPGEEAEVDFGEVWVDLAGARTKCYLFTFRLCHSGRSVHRIYASQSQESFLEGHIDAFEELGGVPTRHIKYDNLSSAVRVVLFGTDRRRVENERWVLFRSFYGFDSFYCRKGLEGAHEKGGVEGEIGRFRRNWLSPVPKAGSLAELNEKAREWDAREEQRRIRPKTTTIGQDLAAERALLAPLPPERFDPGLVLYPRVDRSSLIRVRQATYSVPARLIGSRVRVSLRASELVVFEGGAEVARHERVAVKGGQSVDIDHYLEVLTRKPGALPGSIALAKARQKGLFTAAHEAFWAESRKVNGDKEGTLELIDVLLLHRSMRAADVIAGIKAALSVGAVSADVVAVEARLRAGGATLGRNPDDDVPERGRRVVSLTQRRLTDPAAVIAGLPPDTRPLPDLAIYDELLRRRPKPGAETAETEGTSA